MKKLILCFTNCKTKIFLICFGILAMFTPTFLFAQHDSKSTIEGRWKVLSISYGKHSRPLFKDTEGTIAGQVFGLTERPTAGKRRFMGRYHIWVDPKAHGHINLIPRPSPPKKGRKLSSDEQKYASTGFKGIYQVEGNILEICFPMNSTHARPTKITDREAKGYEYIRMKRLSAPAKLPTRDEKETTGELKRRGIKDSRSL